MKSKKFKELKVGDVIYFCNVSNCFTKETIINNDISNDIEKIIVDEVTNYSDVTHIKNYISRIYLNMPKNKVQANNGYYFYSTSKKIIECYIKNRIKYYINSLKHKVKDGENAKKILNELDKHREKRIWLG